MALDKVLACQQLVQADMLPSLLRMACHKLVEWRLAETLLLRHPSQVVERMEVEAAVVLPSDAVSCHPLLSRHPSCLSHHWAQEPS